MRNETTSPRLLPAAASADSKLVHVWRTWSAKSADTQAGLEDADRSRRSGRCVRIPAASVCSSGTVIAYGAIPFARERTCHVWTRNRRCNHRDHRSPVAARLHRLIAVTALLPRVKFAGSERRKNAPWATLGLLTRSTPWSGTPAPSMRSARSRTPGTPRDRSSGGCGWRDAGSSRHASRHDGRRPSCS